MHLGAMAQFESMIFFSEVVSWFTHPQTYGDLRQVFFLADGLLYAMEESNLASKVILLLLFWASVFSWSVIFTKLLSLRAARVWNNRFLKEYRADRQPMRLFQRGQSFRRSPLYAVYRAGGREISLHLLGSAEIDETYAGRLNLADPINPAQMRAVSTAMERAVGEIGLKLEGRMILLATVVSGAPFLGLLGTVWGVMDTFAAVAATGKASLAIMAPGVSGALVTTVTGLLVAIPAMFGYNFLVSSIKALLVEMENFSAEFSADLEHRYVAHRN
ncbi:MAG: MotA/TolQ/ExbB proton channel family protein [Verrucomicrobiales bacterium]